MRGSPVYQCYWSGLIYQTKLIMTQYHGHVAFNTYSNMAFPIKVTTQILDGKILLTWAKSHLARELTIWRDHHHQYSILTTSETGECHFACLGRYSPGNSRFWQVLSLKYQKNKLEPRRIGELFFIGAGELENENRVKMTARQIIELSSYFWRYPRNVLLAIW